MKALLTLKLRIHSGAKTFTLQNDGGIICNAQKICAGGVFAGNLNQDALLSATPETFERTCRDWLRDHAVNSKYIRYGNKFRRPKFDVNFLISNPGLRAYFAMCIAERDVGRSPVKELENLIDDHYINESENEHYASLPTSDSSSIWAY